MRHQTTIFWQAESLNNSLRSLRAYARRGIHMVENVGHAKGAMLAFNSLSNLATWRAEVASTEASKQIR